MTRHKNNQQEYILIEDDDDNNHETFHPKETTHTLKSSSKTTITDCSTSKKRSIEESVVHTSTTTTTTRTENSKRTKKSHDKFYKYRYEEDLANWIQEHSSTRFAKLRHVDIFDFDSTLFRSPVPNPELWDSRLVNFLKSMEGRWFQDGRTLQEPYVTTARENFIEHVVHIARQSSAYEPALTVLLTGRLDSEYRTRIMELLECAELKFDIICLKEYPRLRSGELSNTMATTLKYKLSFFDHLLDTLPTVNTMAIWDDRIHHVKDFENYLDQQQSKGRLKESIVHHVVPQNGYIPYDLERQLVHELIHEHNARLALERRSTRPHPRSIVLEPSRTHFTGIMLDIPSIRRLLAAFPPPAMWTITADHVTLCPGDAQPEEIARAGGLGAEHQLLVTHVGMAPEYAFAVRVVNAPTSRWPVVSRNGIPHITIAFNGPGGARPKHSNMIQDWLPVEPPLMLSGTMGTRPTFRVVDNYNR